MALTLKVDEAYLRDVGKNVTRIDYSTYTKLNVQSGDYVLVKGAHGKAVAKVLPLYPADSDKKIIRLDKFTRENMKIQVGKNVTLEVGKIKPADKLTILSVEKGISNLKIDGRYVADALEQNVIKKGDTVNIPYFGGRLKFKVKRTKPSGFVQIHQKTEIKLEYLFEEKKKKYAKVRESCDEFLEYMHSKKLDEGQEHWITPLAIIWSNHEESRN